METCRNCGGELRDRWWWPRSPLCQEWQACSSRCVGELHDREVLLPRAEKLLAEMERFFSADELAPVHAAATGGAKIDAMSRLTKVYCERMLASLGLSL